MKLIALNLPRNLTEGDLKKLFETYGSVISCDLVLDSETGLSKGFGFLEMENDNQALIAIETLNGTKLNKNKVRIKLRE